MSSYLPPCCSCWWDNGKYVVGHNEHSEKCKHTPSGGTGGFPDKKTMCDRIIGKGPTRQAAIQDGRKYFNLPTE